MSGATDKGSATVALTSRTKTRTLTEAEWHTEIHTWKTLGGNLSWARWCQIEGLNPADIPRPKLPPPLKVKLKHEK